MNNCVKVHFLYIAVINNRPVKACDASVLHIKKFNLMFLDRGRKRLNR